MENENKLADMPKRKKTILMVYIILLGFLDLSILSLTILTFVTGMSDLVMRVWISIYYLILYLATRTSFEFSYWHPSLLFFILSFFLIVLVLVSIIVAFGKKKWGRSMNIFLLGIALPIFVVIPTSFVWILPDVQYTVPIETVCALSISLLVFDIFYFFWFLKSKQLFE